MVLGCAMLIETLHAHAVRARHHGGKAREAEASFKEIDGFLGARGDRGIDDHLKWNGPPFALLQLLRRMPLRYSSLSSMTAS